MIYTLVQVLMVNIGRILAGAEPVQALGLVLPTASTTGSLTSGLFLVPFWYWIISIAVLVVFHEGMHGVLCAREKVPIKSLGLGLLAVIPLAFVEPDENRLKKKGTAQQMRVFAVGSFANFIIAGLCFVVFAFAFSGFFTAGGVIVSGVVEGTPAYQANLTGAIFQIGSQQVNDVDDLRSALNGISPGDTVAIRTKVLEDDTYVEKSYTLTAIQDPNANVTKSFIGITFSPEPAQSTFAEIKAEFSQYSGLIIFFNGLFLFMFIINLGVGLVNMLPLGPLDGGRMWDVALKRVSPGGYKRIMNGLGFFVLAVIVLTLVSQFVPVGL